MLTRRQALLTCAASLTGLSAEKTSNGAERIRLLRAPEGGLQPQMAIDERGLLHLVYYTGDAHQGDLFYVRSSNFGANFSTALRINSQPGSAVAAGTIRGAQIALGKDGRLHVAWNGSMQAEPNGPLNPDSGKLGMPMLYTRLSDAAGLSFEPQRNLMQHSFGLDGGGSVAADGSGNVFVAWHGIGNSDANGSAKGEARRQVWITKSLDAGRSFSAD